MAMEYGTIAVVPMGEWDANRQYEVANLVTLDGSSYIAHTRPPVGTQPTDTAYWQISAQGASKASESSLGVIKPDGVTTEVNADGVISVKPASQDSPGIVKGSAGITVEEGGSIDVNTTFQQATELANIIAGEAITQVLGKVSKSIAVTMGLDQNALLKSMLTNIDTNDTNKVPSAALVHTLYERIGMAAELTAGDNLTDAVNQLNSNFLKITPAHLNYMGAFVGRITRNASTVSGKQVTLSLTIFSPEAGIAADTPIFYVNGALKGMIGFVLIGNFAIGYVFSTVNEAGDTVFRIRTSSGINAVPGNAEVFIFANGEFV